ncbi:FAD-binding oxidoreductase [Allobranchiibius sp. GilTou73]|uniref:FAD-binding oxidoreductase n=1 Tax=Allobranchiibius sp. GilTou73 TaxID=2904523 RepID=UPI001F295554|nr:FAD-binding oxidoreductase [Allobranchiibius sp. GilTou73]UIJ34582.1 FAD-binding oxidoreductase [Allobranchiibius sp. GilTou73]
MAAVGAGTIGWRRHTEAAAGLVEQLRRIPPGRPVRLAKKTSNLFRARDDIHQPGLDVSRLDGVIEVDPVARTADVQGMATYETLCAATLPHGLMPYVVPQLRTITLGGAVTGLGIESSSFRNGLPHESVLEMDILTGAGEIVTATADGEHADLFHAFPNSYGSLGYSVRLKIALDPIEPYVHLRHVRFELLGDLVDVMGSVVESREHDGERVDFVDGVVFSGEESYLVLGTFTGHAPYTSDYTGQQIFYRSIQSRTEDYLSTLDYIWRWDTDWFWCNRALGLQNPRVRRLVPRRYLRSDVYSRIIRFETRHGVMAGIDARRGKPARERVVQDVELPLGRTQEFLEWFLREVPIEPIWLCPMRLRDVPTASHGEGRPWPLYPMRTGETYVNVGFWSTVAIADGAQDGDVNREIERVVHALDGHKSLYSDAYYEPEEFWAMYGGTTYELVKKAYDPDGRLPDLYTKAVKRR